MLQNLTLVILGGSNDRSSEVLEHLSKCYGGCKKSPVREAHRTQLIKKEREQDINFLKLELKIFKKARQVGCWGEH